MIRGFLAQYYLSFVWIGVAFSQLVLVAGLASTNFVGPSASMLMIPISVASIRVFFVDRRGKEILALMIAAKNWEERLVKLAGILLHNILLWPVWEVIRQLRFLFVAYLAWRKGEILCAENGRHLRAG